MNITKFIFVRHGQSEGNFYGTFLGHTDLPLTELGRKQAEKTAEYLSNKKIDVIYSSDLLRAYQTADPISENHQLSIITDTMYREIYAGKWEGMTFDDIKKDYSDLFDKWKTSLMNAYCPDGETVKDVMKRVYEETIRLANLYSGQTICVVTHATPIRVLKTIALNINHDEAYAYPLANASITEFEFLDNKLKMITDAYSDHLGDLVSIMNRA